MKEVQELRKFSNRITGLHNILSLMQWDQEVMLPSAGTNGRADQFALLSSILHDMIVSPELERLLKNAEEIQDRLPVGDCALVRVMRREYDQNSKLPKKFVSEFSRLTSRALPVWVEARRKSDFSLFLPLLEKIIAFCRQKAEYLGYEKEPYDALLDLYEEGLSTAEVHRIFTSLRPILIELIDSFGSLSAKKTLFGTSFDHDSQIAFSEELLQTIGFDFSRGRQDQSAHPFTTSLGHHDRRVTNRFSSDSIEFIFSALHEGGHALYEQGVAENLAETHLDAGISLGIHESQSRLWENIIGRSLPFWTCFYPRLRQRFPAQFGEMPLASFLHEINAIRPGLIRVEADEVSYNLHILIRFELEKALFDGHISAPDLPHLWNEKYRNYLGIPVADLPAADANGVLQDIHWAHGSFGYFPTYTIGNLAAAQFWKAYCRFDPDHRQTLLTGSLHKIRAWLTDNIYQHGAIFPPGVLIQRVTGEKLSELHFVEYIKDKIHQLQISGAQ